MWESPTLGRFFGKPQQQVRLASDATIAVLPLFVAAMDNFFGEAEAAFGGKGALIVFEHAGSRSSSPQA